MRQKASAVAHGDALSCPWKEFWVLLWCHVSSSLLDPTEEQWLQIA
jgi:hypothetical protein